MLTPSMPKEIAHVFFLSPHSSRLKDGDFHMHRIIKALKYNDEKNVHGSLQLGLPESRGVFVPMISLPSLSMQ